MFRELRFTEGRGNTLSDGDGAQQCSAQLSSGNRVAEFTWWGKFPQYFTCQTGHRFYMMEQIYS